MAHKHSLVAIAGWYLDGLIQWIKHVVPDWLASPDSVGRQPPSWWYDVKQFWDWYGCTDQAGYPLDCWFTHYFQAVWLTLGNWIEEVGEWARGSAWAAVIALTGWVQGGYSTFSDWITAQGFRLGNFVPWWAANLADAAMRLWNLLPSEITGSGRSWWEIWEEIKRAVRDWARARYDEARIWVANSAPWAIGWIGTLSTWWNNAAVFLDAFRQNPVAAVVGWLGDDWRRLVVFARNAMGFYFNLWGTNADTIGALLSNPLLWLYDQAEDFLISMW